MKLPDLYTDWPLILGAVLILLGAGNWIVGVSKIEQYNRILAELRSKGPDPLVLSFQELDARQGRAVLEPLNEQRRKVTYAAAHLDFYHATIVTGRVMFVLGCVVSLVALLGVIRRDARRIVSREASRSARAHGYRT